MFESREGVGMESKSTRRPVTASVELKITIGTIPSLALSPQSPRVGGFLVLGNLAISLQTAQCECVEPFDNLLQRINRAFQYVQRSFVHLRQLPEQPRPLTNSVPDRGWYLIREQQQLVFVGLQFVGELMNEFLRRVVAEV